MSNTVSRQIIFKESANMKGILNETDYVVNMALSAASYINKSFLMRRSYNILLRTLQTKPVVSTTIYNYCFNMTDPILYVFSFKFISFFQLPYWFHFTDCTLLWFLQAISKYICSIHCSNKRYRDITKCMYFF